VTSSRRNRSRRPAGRRAAGATWSGVLAIALLLACGCSARGTHSPAAGAAAPDTLLAALTPKLADWIALWQQATPSMKAESLAIASSGALTMTDIHRFNARGHDESRRLSWFAVWAPDSTRAVDSDTCVDFDPASNVFHRGPPRLSCAALVDLKVNSIATLDTVSATGDFDGALWLDEERFAITGTTTDGDSSGAGRGLVRLYDMGAGTVTEYRLPRVIAPVFEKYRTLREITRMARLRQVSAAH
jgi:hypothetical protein